MDQNRLRLKKRQMETVDTLQQWVELGLWQQFHEGDFDEVIFPTCDVTEDAKLQLTEADVAELRRDDAFMIRYRMGLELISRSWGWDVVGKTRCEPAHPMQQWHGNVKRLHRAETSAKLFGVLHYFDSLRTFERTFGDGDT